MPGQCARCSKTVYFNEEKIAIGKSYHVGCFVCGECLTFPSSNSNSNCSLLLPFASLFYFLFCILVISSSFSFLSVPAIEKDTLAGWSFCVLPPGKLLYRCHLHFLPVYTSVN